MKTQILLFFSWCINLFRPTYIANVCGHKTKKNVFVATKKWAQWIWLPFSTNGSPDYCTECTVNMTARCVRCGKEIFVGDSVTAYMYEGASEPPPYARKYMLAERKTYIGCMRDRCASTRAVSIGYWMPPGKVVQASSIAHAYVQTQPHAVVGGKKNSELFFPPMEELSR